MIAQRVDNSVRYATDTNLERSTIGNLIGDEIAKLEEKIEKVEKVEKTEKIEKPVEKKEKPAPAPKAEPQPTPKVEPEQLPVEPIAAPQPQPEPQPAPAAPKVEPEDDGDDIVDGTEDIVKPSGLSRIGSWFKRALSDAFPAPDDEDDGDDEY